MDSLNKNLREIYSNYKDWVRRNPQTASEVETTIKYISYFVAGKINNKSIILTEAVYSASNLLVLFNDLIIKCAKCKLNSCRNKIKIWLSIIEYLEVLLEVSFKRLWGEKGKWIIIFSIQLLKCAARLTLLLHYHEKIMSCPAVMPCNRRAESEYKNDGGIPRINKIAFSLKRSGRIIRKVDSAPSFHNRLWKPPTFSALSKSSDEKPDNRIVPEHLIGEMLYIIKPIITLKALLKYGQTTWKPWLVSAITDIASLYLLHSNRRNQASRPPAFTSDQSLEISRRHLMLLLYLMRSPFYEKYSKDRIQSLLTGLSRHIPLAKIICGPIEQFLPYRQDTYFYLWSS